ncbi:MAG: hypothetical protein PHN39_00500 [Candidatus Pacebacteria bacterium]|nr:hypothetical protein [Candidatus Paceibacterota bacterium]
MNRKDLLDQVIKDLNGIVGNGYDPAVRINEKFFQAAHSWFSYVWWLLTEAPGLRKNRQEIQEFMDLPFLKWQAETHRQLGRLERLKFPGLIEPLKQALLTELPYSSNEPTLLLSLGCGTMEVERQLAEAMTIRNLSIPMVIIGIDNSLQIEDEAAQNLNGLASRGVVDFQIIKQVDHENLTILCQKTKEAAKIQLAICNTDLFSLQDLPEGLFDMVYHSRLKHHIKMNNKTHLDELIEKLCACKAFEFDDYFSVPNFIFPSFITWKWPLTLNGAILSYLRDASKKELKGQANDRWALKFFNLGFYLRTLTKAQNNQPPRNIGERLNALARF